MPTNFIPTVGGHKVGGHKLVGIKLVGIKFVGIKLVGIKFVGIKCGVPLKILRRQIMLRNMKYT